MSFLDEFNGAGAPTSPWVRGTVTNINDNQASGILTAARINTSISGTYHLYAPFTEGNVSVEFSVKEAGTSNTTVRMGFPNFHNPISGFNAQLTITKRNSGTELNVVTLTVWDDLDPGDETVYTCAAGELMWNVANYHTFLWEIDDTGVHVTIDGTLTVSCTAVILDSRPDRFYLSQTGGSTQWPVSWEYVDLVDAGGGDPDAPPATPSIEVEASQTTAELTGSAYSQEAATAHQASRWQVRLASVSDWLTPVFDSGWDTVNLTSIEATGLDPNTEHEARVTYRSANSVESATSAVEAFTTVIDGSLRRIHEGLIFRDQFDRPDGLPGNGWSVPDWPAVQFEKQVVEDGPYYPLSGIKGVYLADEDGSSGVILGVDEGFDRDSAYSGRFFQADGWTISGGKLQHNGATPAWMPLVNTNVPTRAEYVVQVQRTGVPHPQIGNLSDEQAWRGGANVELLLRHSWNYVNGVGPCPSVSTDFLWQELRDGRLGDQQQPNYTLNFARSFRPRLESGEEDECVRQFDAATTEEMLPRADYAAGISSRALYQKGWVQNDRVHTWVNVLQDTSSGANFDSTEDWDNAVEIDYQTQDKRLPAGVEETIGGGVTLFPLVAGRPGIIGFRSGQVAGAMQVHDFSVYETNFITVVQLPDGFKVRLTERSGPSITNYGTVISADGEAVLELGETICPGDPLTDPLASARSALGRTILILDTEDRVVEKYAGEIWGGDIFAFVLSPHCEVRELELVATVVPEETDQPAPIFLPASPDWKAGIIEGRHWLTDVILSDNETEQRVALRGAPRRTLRYTPMTLTARESAIFSNLLYRRSSERFLVPIWQDCTLLTAGADAADEEVLCNTLLRTFVAGGRAILWESHDKWEEVDVIAVTDTSLEVSPLTYAWPRGSEIAPLGTGILGNKQEVLRPASFAMQMALEFRLEVGSDPRYVGEYTSQPFEGLEVLTLMPSRGGDYADTLSRKTHLLDNDTGILRSRQLSEWTVVERSFQWLLFGREEVMTFLAWLEHCEGRYNAFWMPTWNRDLVMVEVDGNDLTVEDVGYTSQLFPLPERRVVAIVDWDGTVYTRRVVAATDNGDGTETLTLSTAPPDVTPEMMISYLTLSRLADDSVTATWFTTDSAEVELNIQEIPFELL